MPSKYYLAAALAASLGSAQALAAPVFTVDASYDPFITGNTTISITNDTGATETDVVLSSGLATESLGSIAAGATVAYTFNEVSGPFVDGSGNTGLADTTDYQVTALVAGQTLTSNTFSPVANLTGGYVDFLGACFTFGIGCSVDPTVNYPLSGLVAAASAPSSAVPEPSALAPFGAALAMLAGLAVVRRRPR